MKKMIFFLVVAAIFASFISCSGNTEKTTEQTAENAGVMVDSVSQVASAVEEVDDPRLRLQIESIIAQYIQEHGSYNTPPELYKVYRRKHTQEQVRSIALGALYGETVLKGTPYWINGGTVSDYFLLAQELQVACVSGKNVQQAARDLLVWQSTEWKEFISMDNGFLTRLTARKELIGKGFNRDNIRSCTDSQLLKNAGIDVLSNKVLFDYCRDIEGKELDAKTINLFLKEREESLKINSRQKERVDKELVLVLAEGTSPTLEIIKALSGNSTPEEHKKAEALKKKLPKF